MIMRQQHDHQRDFQKLLPSFVLFSALSETGRNPAHHPTANNAHSIVAIIKLATAQMIAVSPKMSDVAGTESMVVDDRGCWCCA